MHRFFVPPAWLGSDPLVLHRPLTHQLSRVLRMRPGEHIVLLDNSGWAYEVVLETIAPDRATARLVARMQPETETAIHLTLCQSLTREKKFDWVLQKGTELGVAAFVPLITEHSLLGETMRLSATKLDRWQRIVTEAAEQSGRACVPEVARPMSFVEACASIGDGTLGLVACVGEGAVSLRRILEGERRPWEKIRLFIGPEGGFSPEEMAGARDAGLRLISLGPRILRTETAGIVAIAAILYALDELG